MELSDTQFVAILAPKGSLMSIYIARRPPKLYKIRCIVFYKRYWQPSKFYLNSFHEGDTYMRCDTLIIFSSVDVNWTRLNPTSSYFSVGNSSGSGWFWVCWERLIRWLCLLSFRLRRSASFGLQGKCEIDISHIHMMKARLEQAAFINRNSAQWK